MLTRIAMAVAAAAATVTLAGACEVPEDDGTTAADRAETKDVGKKDVKKKDKGAAKAAEKPDDSADVEEAVAEPEPLEQEAPKETAGQAQARGSAEQYLDYTAFSRSGLIEQLEFEGFSTKDATYGADAQHADWNKQAALSAKQYLDMSSFSRSGLIQQLEFEGYTTEQATYGVDQVGL